MFTDKFLTKMRGIFLPEAPFFFDYRAWHYYLSYFCTTIRDYLKTTFRHIIVYLLTAVVFFSTMGVSVHHLYCMCKGEATASLIRPSDPCEMSPSLPLKDCCKGGGCHQQDSTEKHDCTSCVTNYVKLDVPFVLPSLDLKIEAPVAHFPALLMPKLVFFTPVKTLKWLQDISPPGGKELLPWIQTFLC